MRSKLYGNYMLKINDMKKTFRYVLMAVLTVGLSFAVTSCKDDDNDNGNGTEQQGSDSTEGTMTLADDQLSSLIYQWCDVQSGDLSSSSLRQKTYDVTEGVVLDESRPTVRSVEVGTIEGADAYAARALHALGIDNQNPAGFSFSDAEVGTVSYKHGGTDANVLATVDVDVKQLPGLTRMQLVKQLPENAGGEPYYQMGDVICFSKKNPNTGYKETNYAICVSQHTKSQKAVFITLNDQKMHKKGKFGWDGVGTDSVWSASQPNASETSLYNWLKYIVLDEDKWQAVRHHLLEAVGMDEEDINTVVPSGDAQRHQLIFNMSEEYNIMLDVMQTPEESDKIGIWGGAALAGSYFWNYINQAETDFCSAPHGNLLANWVRYKTYFDFSPWNMWVPYIILVKDSQFAEWQTGLNKVVPLTSLSTSHFKWKDLGTVTLTRTLSGNTYLGTKTVKPKTFHVLLVATHWRHITVRNLDEPTKIIFDFTKDWRQQPDKKLLTREGYNDIQCIWNRMEITSSEFSFTDEGKRNTYYTDIYIQKNDQ